ncbi:DUF2333 family protein [Agarivorans sp. MS3-6]|uniref:DUF2333 family protein n=1 Tax=Agarivorans sp. TSD2052 TaxID=2937286 RepID=UPI00200F857F|nr:DUF2333 family protein [Agarivorans sp. TSD2052]UPW16901.1 DUF2333 family protein [Agarivorans sp. TSD2052]
MFQLTGRKVVIFALIFLIINYIVAVIWSSEPERIDIKLYSQEQAVADGQEMVTGYATTTALAFVAQTLLDKPGGYLSNDKMPPSVFMDNMPSWELGALNQVRDLSLVMRKDFSRSQAQSVEHAQLKIAQPKFNIDHTSWQLPSAEGEYQEAIKALLEYRRQLADPTDPNAQFYARADNLVTWLNEVQSRLGGMSQKLSASVGRERLNTSLVGEEGAEQSTFTPSETMVKTSWWKIDDVFYEARGEAWALLHFFQAVEVDFKGVLEKKNATIAVRQIVRELEATQEPIWSPMILNGTGFGLVANHSLVMANYISRANAAIINLNNLLTNG